MALDALGTSQILGIALLATLLLALALLEAVDAGVVEEEDGPDSR